MAKSRRRKKFSIRISADMLPGHEPFLILDEETKKYSFICLLHDEDHRFEIDSVSDPVKNPDGNWHTMVKVKQGKDPLGYLIAASFDFAVESEVDSSKQLIINISYPDELKLNSEQVAVDFAQSNSGNEQLEKIAKYLLARLVEAKAVFSPGSTTSRNYRITPPDTQEDENLTMLANWSLSQYYVSQSLDSTVNPTRWTIYLTTTVIAGGKKYATSPRFSVTRLGYLTT